MTQELDCHLNTNLNAYVLPFLLPFSWKYERFLQIGPTLLNDSYIWHKNQTDLQENAEVLQICNTHHTLELRHRITVVRNFFRFCSILDIWKVRHCVVYSDCSEWRGVQASYVWHILKQKRGYMSSAFSVHLKTGVTRNTCAGYNKKPIAKTYFP